MDTAFPAASVFATGFALCATLIVAIGAQNAFVLRQGLRREHVGAVVAFCATADALLLALGVAGVGAALARVPALVKAVTIGGAAFLVAYGLLALRRAVAPAADGLRARADAARRPASRRAVLAQAAAFTLLNPHVYLDTVLLAGTIGARQPEALRTAFVAGGAAASLVWFVALGFGAGRLAPWFASPRAWRILDAVVGATMLALATALVMHGGSA